MERLTINIPESKSAEIKQFLKRMGVSFSASEPLDVSGYKKKLMSVGKWSKDDLKALNDVRDALNTIKPQEW